MVRQVRFLILGVAVVLVVALLLWRLVRQNETTPLSSPLTPPAQLTSLIPSPLHIATAGAVFTPPPAPPTVTPPVDVAALELMRTLRPTATLPSPSGVTWPYVAPDTWRAWALRVLAAAGVLTYIGLRLRRGQKA